MPDTDQAKNAIRTFRRLHGRMPEAKELAHELRMPTAGVYRIFRTLVSSGTLVRQPRYVLSETRAAQ